MGERKSGVRMGRAERGDGQSWGGQGVGRWTGVGKMDRVGRRWTELRGDGQGWGKMGKGRGKKQGGGYKW